MKAERSAGERAQSVNSLTASERRELRSASRQAGDLAHRRPSIRKTEDVPDKPKGSSHSPLSSFHGDAVKDQVEDCVVREIKRVEQTAKW